MITYLLTYIFIAYGITTIVVYGDIFSSLRDWVLTKSEFIHNIFSCPLCFSTWLGFTMSAILIVTDNITPSSEIFNYPIPMTVFLDGVFTAGVVWFLNRIER